MEQKKYELTKKTMCFDGVTLHRIQALKDFGNVNAGELGGWVEDEFVPNFLDNGQRKYYPYFVRDPGDAKHIIVNASSTVSCDALCLNRICFKSEKRAMQFGEQFISLFKQILLK